jgi:sterol desaturase/sphingolipid hydroxylase (fatty acid hydroxylase superfamily)
MWTTTVVHMENAFVAATTWMIRYGAVIATVVTLTLIAIDQLRRRVRSGRDPRQAQSAATSLTSAMAFLTVKTVLGKLAYVSVAVWVYEHWRLTTLDLTLPVVWATVFVARDCIYYWVHRAEHRMRILWASHLVHHSPQEIGFTTAVRVPWMEAIYKPWFGLWLPLIGFHPAAAIAMDVVAAVIGQLYHTRRVRRIPVIEQIFVTPAAHRVHHGSNPEYIDKNFGAVLIVWDRLFGTFAAEVAPVRYGIGSKRVDTPTEALVGGYPSLLSEMSGLPGAGRKVRHLVTAPGT